MLDYSQVASIAREAAQKARRAGKRPLSIQGFDSADVQGFCRRIPFLGDYVPEGWVPALAIDDLFVDASGFGGDNEPALSLAEFGRRLSAFRASGDNYGFGVVEAGEFQVYVRVYVPDPRDFTHTGNLTAADLRKVRDD